MSELAWIDAALIGARPTAVAALLRYFRDLDTAEEAFQEACLRALKTWPENGPPRDAASWLIMVGRNSALDQARKKKRQEPLGDRDEAAESADYAEALDESRYRDDVLRLMFVCAHPELPAVQQVALALRLVSGLSVGQIARAFLVSEDAMEQRITRAKKRVATASAEVPFEAPGPGEREERLGAVAAMVYLVFNEGYSTSTGAESERAALCDEAIRLGRLLVKLFPEPEVMGLTALMLLQHSRAAARFAADGSVVLLDDQDRGKWDRERIAEGMSLVDKAMRHRAPGPYQVQAAIAALHARAASPAATDWAQIDLLYQTLEQLTPSPVVTLNRAVAVKKVHGAAAALAIVEPLAKPLASYFYFHGLRGALLLELDRRADAKVAFDKAIALANTPAEAAHIRQHLDQLSAR